MAEQDYNLEANLLEQALAERNLEDVREDDEIPDGIVEWCEQNKRVDGHPFRIRNREFLRDIYEDWHQKVCVKKSAQIGLTVCAISKVQFFLVHRRVNVIYTMPSAKDVTEFTQARWDKDVQESPTLGELSGEPDNVTLKQFGKGFIFFRGTWTERQAISVPSDMNVHDELDFSFPDTISMFKARLNASPWQYQLLFSTPSYPGVGIDKIFNDKSDQRHWQIECPHCDHEFALCCAYPDAIHFVADCPDKADRKRMQKHGMERYFGCPNCKGELTPEDRISGKWVATNPGAEWHGYHPTSLCAPWYTADDIMEAEGEYSKPKDFTNLVLGQCFANSTMSVTPEDVRKCFDKRAKFHPRADPVDRCTMGVDQGDVIYVIISKEATSGKRQIVKTLMLGLDAGFKTLDRLMKQYSIARCVIDALPNKLSARQFAERWPGKVYCAYYTRPSNKPGLVDWDADWENKRWQAIIHRSDALDHSYDRILKGFVTLPAGNGADEELERFFIKQMCNLRREQHENVHGEPEIKYVRVGADHFAHANLYDEMARMGIGGTAGVRAMRRRPEPEPDPDEKKPRLKQRDRVVQARNRSW